MAGAADFADLGAKPLGAADFADLQDAPAEPAATASPEERKRVRDLAIKMANVIFADGGIDELKATLEAAGFMGSQVNPNLPDPMSLPRGVGRYAEPEGASAGSQALNFAGRAAIPAATSAAMGAALGPAGAGAGLVRGIASTAAQEAVIGAGSEIAGQAIARAAGNKDALSAGEVGKQAALSGTLGGAARGVGEVAIRGIPPAKQAVKNVAELASKYGLDLTPAEISASRALSGLEAFLEKTVLGSSPIMARRAANTEALRAAKDKLIAQAGTDKEKQAVGLAFFDMLRSRADKFNNAVKEAYSRAFQSVPEDAELPVENFLKVARDLATRAKKSPFGGGGAGKTGSDVTGFFAKATKEANDAAMAKAVGEDVFPVREGFGDNLDAALEGIIQPGAKKITPQDLIDIRTDLTQAIADYDAGIKLGLRTMSSRQAGAYKMLLSAIERDMDAYAVNGGSDFVGKYRAAKKLAKQNFETFNDKRVVSVLKGTPEAVPGVIGYNSVSDVQALKKAAGDKGFDIIRQSWLTNLLNDSKRQAGNSLEKELGRYTPETIGEVFKSDPKALADLREIARLQSLVGSVERGTPMVGSARVVANTGPQTIGAIIGSAAGGTVGAGAGALAATVAPAAIAEAYLSPTTRKIVLDGLRAAPGSREKLIAASRLAAILGKSSVSEGSRK